MERSLEIRTGEAVAIRYELAGLGSRFLALMVDLIAQVAIAIALLVAFAFAGPGLARLVPFGGKNLAAWGIALAVLLLFLIFFGWFIVFETWWSGRSPGKRALGLRVVRDGGFPIDAGAAIIRNLVRIVEFGLGFYALSAISALLSPENKRLGDFAAGTVVVRPAHAESGIAEADRLLIERFLARRATLDPLARMRLATRIADRVRPMLRDAHAQLDDERLLEYLVGR